MIVVSCRYLSKFDKLSEFPRERKGAEYKRYLGMLLDYFYSFISRVRPLYDLHEAMDVIKREFDTKWAVGDVTGKATVNREGKNPPLCLTFISQVGPKS